MSLNLTQIQNLPGFFTLVKGAFFNSNEAIFKESGNAFVYFSNLASGSYTSGGGSGSYSTLTKIVTEGNYFYYHFQGANHTLESRLKTDLTTIVDTVNVSATGTVYDMVASNGFLYVLHQNTMKIYGIVAGLFSELSTTIIASDTNNKRITVSGNYAYLCNNNELRVYNISNPAAPTLVVEASDGDNLSRKNLKNPQVIGNYLYATSSDFLIVRDISNIGSALIPLAAEIDLGFGGFVASDGMKINGTDILMSENASLLRGFSLVTPITVDFKGSITTTGTGPYFLDQKIIHNETGALNIYTYAFSANPPNITTHPTTQLVSAGGTLSLSVVSSGDSPLTYQWKKNGVDILLATNSTYVKNNVQPSDAGSYTVVVTNVAGNDTSDPAIITVSTNVSISAHPSNTTILEGNTLNLSVSASGGIPISYQWKKDGINLIGQNNPTLTLNATNPVDSGQYTVVVANSYNAITSNPATVVVNPLPTSLLELSDTFPDTGNLLKTIVVGTKAFCLAESGGQGIVVIDVTNPATPTFLSKRMYNIGNVIDMCTDGTYLYVGTTTSIYSVFIDDVVSGAETELSLLTHFTLNPGFGISWILCDGISLYIASNPNSGLREVIKYELLDGAILSILWRRGLSSSVSSQMATLEGDYLVESSVGGTMRSIHKTTGIIASTKTGISNLGSGLAMKNNAIYIAKASGFGGFSVFAFNTSTGVIGNELSSGVFGSNLSSSISTITVSNNTLFVTDGYGKISLFDIVNSQNVLFLSNGTAQPEPYRTPCILDSVVYATTISNPSRFVTLGFNTSPVITSVAPTLATIGILYTYTPTLFDLESDIDHWELINPPAGMTVNPSTGVVSWTPTSGQFNSGYVYLKAVDSSNLIDVEKFIVYVNQGLFFTSGTPLNSPPTPSGNVLHLPANTYNSGSALFEFLELPQSELAQSSIKFLDYGFKITTSGSTTFDNPITLEIHYTDAQLEAVGITKTKDENKLKVMFFDTNTNQWISLVTQINPGQNIAYAELPHLTEFSFGLQSGDSNVQTEVNGQEIIVLDYMRDEFNTGNYWYSFIDASGNLKIAKSEIHSAGEPPDQLGGNSQVI